MAETTKIEWCDSTLNPWIGCQNVSPGCEHCYAEEMNGYRKWTEWGPHGVRRRTSPSTWAKVNDYERNAAAFQRKHGRRQRVFCASLADVFDNKAPDGARDDLWHLIRRCPNVDFLLLTKRPQNIRKMLPADWGSRFGYPNVWLGTTTEDAEHYQQRWPVLAAVPATIRFISYEPAVGPLGPLQVMSALTEYGARVPDWVIAGGESGPRARRMNPDWARAARDQCVPLGVAFFFKQWGSWPSNPAREADNPLNGKGGGLLDGRLWREFPQQKTAPRDAMPLQNSELPF